MKTKNTEFIRILNGMLDKEIDGLSELLDILGADNSVTDTEDLEGDLLIINNKRNMFKNFKGMVKKTSLQVEGLDNEILLNKDEKRIFFKLVKTISFFRRLFRRK